MNMDVRKAGVPAGVTELPAGKARPASDRGGSPARLSVDRSVHAPAGIPSNLSTRRQQGNIAAARQQPAGEVPKEAASHHSDADHWLASTQAARDSAATPSSHVAAGATAAEAQPAKKPATLSEAEPKRISTGSDLADGVLNTARKGIPMLSLVMTGYERGGWKGALGGYLTGAKAAISGMLNSPLPLKLTPAVLVTGILAQAKVSEETPAIVKQGLDKTGL